MLKKCNSVLVRTEEKCPVFGPHVDSGKNGYPAWLNIFLTCKGLRGMMERESTVLLRRCLLLLRLSLTEALDLLREATSVG